MLAYFDSIIHSHLLGHSERSHLEDPHRWVHIFSSVVLQESNGFGAGGRLGTAGHVVMIPLFFLEYSVCTSVDHVDYKTGISQT